jgi:peptidoglycan-associated lipoprotein
MRSSGNVVVDRRQSTAYALTAVLIVITIAAGCAKKPVASTASATVPTPTGPPIAVTPPGGEQRPSSGPPSNRASTPRPRPIEFTPTTALRDIYYDFDGYALRADHVKVLDMNAAWLKDNSNKLLLIEGHADERGTNEYNLALGERRAKAAADYLVSQGVRAARISTISYGEERPLCVLRTEACWARNRRAHFLIRTE